MWETLEPKLRPFVTKVRALPLAGRVAIALALLGGLPLLIYLTLPR